MAMSRFLRATRLPELMSRVSGRFGFAMAMRHCAWRFRTCGLSNHASDSALLQASRREMQEDAYQHSQHREPGN